MTPEMREEWRLLSKEATQIQRYVSGLRLGALSFIIAAAISIVAAAYLLWMEAPLWGVLGCWAAWLYCSLRVSQYNGKVRRLEDG